MKKVVKTNEVQVQLQVQLKVQRPKQMGPKRKTGENE
jgi:hypothetical protein